jgi:hypothetical protein
MKKLHETSFAPYIPNLYIYLTLTVIFQGKISREEVALICVAALESPSAVGKTFEVKFLQLTTEKLRRTLKVQKAK